MDGHGFDLLTKRLALMMTRRQGFRSLLAGMSIAGLAALDVGEAEAACGSAGTPCNRGKECCSTICKRDDEEEGEKKGKKGRKKGRCDFSFPQEACNRTSDCLFETSVCGKNACDPDKRCCESKGDECIDLCDCCDTLACAFEAGQEFGQCVPCTKHGRRCGRRDACCDRGDDCDDNGGGRGNVCCTVPGFKCDNDFDCCGAGRCSGRAKKTCQLCPAIGELCNAQTNNCCDKKARCFDNACGQAGSRCCLEAGEDCETDCDCCELHVCNPNTKTCRRNLD